MLVKFTPLIFLIFHISSCTIKTTQENNSASVPEIPAPVEHQLANGLTIKELVLDTLTSKHNCRGIRISFVASANQNFINAFESSTYTAGFVNISLVKDSKIYYSKLENLKSQFGKQVAVNKGSFFSREGEHYIETIIPFFALNLPEGLNKTEVVLEVLPATFTNESATRNFQKLEYISDQALGKKQFPFSFSSPGLSQTELIVKGYEIETSDTKKGKFDFSITGKGKPDPYWQLKCGEEIIYTSKPIKNSYKVSVISNSGKFRYTPEDKFTITVYDYDQGPFNGKDIIGTWSGTINELKENNKNIEFGRVRNFEYKFKQ